MGYAVGMKIFLGRRTKLGFGIGGGCGLKGRHGWHGNGTTQKSPGGDARARRRGRAKPGPPLRESATSTSFRAGLFQDFYAGAGAYSGGAGGHQFLEVFVAADSACGFDSDFAAYYGAH
jgi:hypothetical protein